MQKQWRDQRGQLILELWAAADPYALHVTLTDQEAVMFVERDVVAQANRRKPVALKSLRGEAVDALYFRSQGDLIRERSRLREQGVTPFEADIKPVERYLMERFVTGSLVVHGRAENHASAATDRVLHFHNPRVTAPTADEERARAFKLRVLSLDIETDGFEGALLSISGVTEEERCVFLVNARLTSPPPVPGAQVSVFASERDALLSFATWLRERDPDAIIGWNVVDFDLKYLAKLAKRLKVQLALGRDGTSLQIIEPRTQAEPRVAKIAGRAVLDGIATLRSATLQFESYALADVAQELLGRGKKIETTEDPAEEIRRMAREDPAALCRYNLEDCQLVLDIFARARLIDFVVERKRLTGLPMDRQGGSVAAFDQLYLPRLHRASYVAPSVGDRVGRVGSPGGFVMESLPGLYRNVLVFDFKSLYPSIIRTFLVDPLGLAQPGEDPVPGFEGATFAREGHILPDLVRTLWAARDDAKREKNAGLSQAIKIMMNSFYGVLGTPGCRFFDHRLVTSITLRGHEIIQEARAFLEKRGLCVIYGDTDSVFVLLGPGPSPEECDARGRDLARDLTAHFKESLQETLRVESHLELQYERHFRRFLMPTIRGSEQGTKKRYAGSVVTADGSTEVIFKGLEAVRTDWTPLARRFQRELFRRVFADEPYREFVSGTARELLSGRLDSELVYRKRLRRGLADYQKNVPPHVQAARKLEQTGRSIEYVITVNGPEPAAKRVSAIDYDHYLNRQLAPAAESLLRFLDVDFSALAGRQMSLF